METISYHEPNGLNEANNEPHGESENQERHQSELSNEHSEEVQSETDYSQNDIAGNASGNTPEDEENLDDDGTGYTENKAATQNDGKGFLGDFKTVQHDDERDGSV